MRPPYFARVVQLVRAPPCHGGSCGFEPRLSRFMSHTYLISLLIFFLCAGCKSQSPEEYREEGRKHTRTLIENLKSIHSRQELLKAQPILKKQFSEIAALLIEAQEFYSQHPDAEQLPLSQQDQLLNAELRKELERLYGIEEGREMIEKSQEEALDLLNTYDKRFSKRTSSKK